MSEPDATAAPAAVKQVGRRWLQPVPLGEAGYILVAFLTMLMLPGSWVNADRLEAPVIVLGMVALVLGTRRLIAIVPGFAVVALVTRLMKPGEYWSDQLFFQQFSISSLLSGHNIYDTANLTETTWAAYLPMGSLFGGAAIVLGFERYWLVYHCLVVLLLLVPVAAHLSPRTAAGFVALAFFFPSSLYTSGGGTIEISHTLIFVGSYLLLLGVELPAAAVLLGFAAMMRPNDLVLLPFVAVILLRARRLRVLAVFVASVTLFGGWYLVRNPVNFASIAIGNFELWSQIWYNRAGSLSKNYSVSSVLAFFGLGESTAWSQLAPLYTPLTAVALAALLLATLSVRRRSQAVALAICAPLAVLVLARGYVLLHYVVGACIPFMAFFFVAQPVAGPPTSRSGPLSLVRPREWLREVRRGFYWPEPDASPTPRLAAGAARAAAAAFACLGLVPLVVSLTHWRDPGAKLAVEGKPVPVRELRLLDPNGRDQGPVRSDAGQPFEVPVGWSLLVIPEGDTNVDVIRLVGPPCSTVVFDGVAVPHAFQGGSHDTWPVQVSVAVSEDGVTFGDLRTMRSLVNYVVFPLDLELPALGRPLRAIRLRVDRCYLDRDKATVGLVELFTTTR